MKTIKTIMLLAAAIFVLAANPMTPAGFVSAAWANSKEEDPNAPKPEFEYLEMAPLVLPIITESGLTQQVSLVVSLELPYGKTAEVKPYEPKLADAYLQDLYGALGTGHAMMRGGVIDVMAVKTRLTDVTTKVLGADKFHSVLLQVVQQRPM